MNDDTNQRARECLAKAAEQFGGKEVPKALRAGDIALINSDIALSAITSAREEALREAAEKLEPLARMLCEQHGGNPDSCATDEHDCWDGPLWTVFIPEAEAILSLITGGGGYVAD